MKSIPYFVIKSWFPSHLASKVAKRYLEVIQKYPPDNTLWEMLVRNAIKTTKKGIKTLTICEIKEGKLEEANTLIGNLMAMFIDIEGHEYSIETWATDSEAPVWGPIILRGRQAPER